MGIWIRSQDKTSLMYCQGVYTQYSEDINVFVIALVGGKEAVLATYDTCERAQSVLESIQQFIACDGEMNGYTFRVYEMPTE